MQIVIHASGVVGALLEEELGSGYFDLQATSGSGWSDANGEGSVTTYIDDEDFTAHKVEIDVQCRVPRASVTAGAEVCVCAYLFMGNHQVHYGLVSLGIFGWAAYVSLRNQYKNY